MQLCSLHSAECTIKIVHLYPHVAVLNTEVSSSFGFNMIVDSSHL